jgi:uncharacterized protein (TIGR02246 family)
MTSVMNRILVLVCTAGFALACQTQEPATEQASETDPAVDATATREAIEAVDTAWEDAAMAGNAAAIAALYTTDAIAMPPGGPRTEGREAIQALFGGWISDYGLTSIDLSSDMITVAASGDLATAAGSYTASGTAPDGTEWTETGKYVEIFKSVDGNWQIAADIWNHDAAPTGMESETAASDPAPAE